LQWKLAESAFSGVYDAHSWRDLGVGLLQKLLKQAGLK